MNITASHANSTKIYLKFKLYIASRCLQLGFGNGVIGVRGQQIADCKNIPGIQLVLGRPVQIHAHRGHTLGIPLTAQLAHAVMVRNGAAIGQALVPGSALNLFVSVHGIRVVRVLETEIKVNTGTRVIGLRDTAGHKEVRDVQLFALPSHPLLDVFTESFAAVPRHGRFKGLGHDAIAKSEVLELKQGRKEFV